MPNRVQIGPEVDERLWKEFRNTVKEEKGQVRGVLGDELENAIREYLRDDSSPTERRLERRIARIEQAVGAAPTDGGTDIPERRPHTHAPTEAPTERPAANTSTDKKIAWLARCVRENHGDDFKEVTRNDLQEVVKDEYGFRRDTAKRYVENLIDHFDLMTHPATDKVLVTEDRHEQIQENRREGLHKEPQEELNIEDTE